MSLLFRSYARIVLREWVNFIFGFLLADNRKGGGKEYFYSKPPPHLWAFCSAVVRYRLRFLDYPTSQRYRKVTICARKHSLAEPKSPSPMPLVMPFCAAQATASA